MTVCPLAVRIGVILLLLSVAVPTGGSVVAVVGGSVFHDWRYEWPMLAMAVLGAVSIVSGVFTLLGRRWAYYVTLVVSLPTVIVPALLLVSFGEYMAYAGHVEMRAANRKAMLG